MMPNAVIILSLVLNLCLALALILLRSYFKEKGKNLAQKEDLNELTRIVEEVKSAFNHESEVLRHQLSLMHTKKSKTYDDRKAAIVNFYSRFNICLESLSSPIVTQFNPTIEQYTQKRETVRLYLRDVFFSLSTCDIILEDDDLMKKLSVGCLQTTESRAPA